MPSVLYSLTSYLADVCITLVGRCFYSKQVTTEEIQSRCSHIINYKVSGKNNQHSGESDTLASAAETQFKCRFGS